MTLDEKSDASRIDHIVIPAAVSARDEWRENWTMVLAAMAGFSLSTIAVHSMGVFITPLSNDLGWSRAQITSGLTIFAVLAAPLAPFAGALIDRVGSRRLALPGIVVFSATFAAFGLTTSSMWMWWSLWTVFALFSLAVHTAIWTTAIAGRFVAGRGLALGLTLCGTSIAQVIAPPLANFLIETQGWRNAYLWMGAGWGGVVLALVTLFFHDKLSVIRRNAGAEVPARALGGLSMGQALRSLRIWRIAITELLVSMINLSLIVHMVPLLITRGIESGQAAFVSGSVGLFAIFGKLFTGWLLDRSQSSWIPAISMWLPAVSCLLFLSSGELEGIVYLAAAVFGYAVGAYFQIVTYLSTRYAGLANFGKIFGIMAGLMAVGTGLGPLLAGYVYDLFGSYDPWLLGAAGLSIMSGFLLMGLGPYPDWDEEVN